MSIVTGGMAIGVIEPTLAPHLKNQVSWFDFQFYNFFSSPLPLTIVTTIITTSTIITIIITT
jgi:hypothetical protein